MKPTKKQRKLESLAQYSEELASRLREPNCPSAVKDRADNRKVDQRKRAQRRGEIRRGIR